MQRLIYVNLAGEEIEFCNYPFVLEKVSGLGLPDVEMETIRGAYQQGNTIAGTRRGDRVITVYFHLLAPSRSAMYDMRMLLLGILSVDKAIDGEDRAYLIYENDAGRRMTYAVPEGGLDAGKRFLNNQPSLRLNFRCESPFVFDVDETAAAFSFEGDCLEFPFSFPIAFGLRDYEITAINTGHVSTPVRVEIECKGETPSLYNATTGKRLSLSSPIPSGYTLILNTDPARLDARMVDASGNELSAFGKLSLETPLADFVLVPGVNTLIYEPGGASAQSEITVSWRNAFEGV